MPVAEQTKHFVNFTGGLNTEATPLNFPENAAQELDNIDLFSTGEVKRRLGLEFETSYTIRPETTSAGSLTTDAISHHEWKAVNGKGDLNFAVVQIGTDLFFHDLGTEPVSGTLRGSVNLDGFRTLSDARRHLIDISYGEGIAIATSHGVNPTAINYDEDLNQFFLTIIDIQIRDFDGVEDNLAVDARPASLTKEHEYNLRNQGWPLLATVSKSRSGSKGTKDGDPIALTKEITGLATTTIFDIEFDTGLGIYPSNSDIIWATRAVQAEAGKEEVIGAYSPLFLNDVNFGNTPAPKGHFLYNAFNVDRAGVSGLPLNDDETVSTSNRPSATAFYSGRAWYAGVRDKNYVGDIFFSQLVQKSEDVGKCFQRQDPTAEDLNGLIATDGGVIHVADMGEVRRMVEVGQDLVVVAANGVWAISGTSGGNFTANDFTVRKLSDNGSSSKDSVVEAENALFWWSDGGIWAMTSGQISDTFQVSRITKDTIQTFYEEIPAASRAYARAFYDEFNKKINWLYNDTPGYDSINFRFRYNRMLVFDLTLKAFYTHTFEDLDTNTPWVSAMTAKEPGSEAIVNYNIVLLGDNIVLSGDNIVQDVAFEQFADSKIKLLSFVQNENTTYSYTYSEFSNRSFTDWKAWDIFKNNPGNIGADYSSVIQAGWQDFKDPIRVKSITHLTSFFNLTETGYSLDGEGEIIFDDPSGALVQTRWEWTDDDVGRWTDPTDAYRLNRFYIPASEFDPFDYGFSIVKTKLRMRGKGNSFSVRYTSTPGDDFQLVGFSLNVKAGTKV